MATSPPPQPETQTEFGAEELVAWLKRHQSTIAWVVGGAVLVVFVIVFVLRDRARTVDEAAKQLASTTGVEPLRRLNAEYGTTVIGPQIRYHLARALLDAETQLDRQPSGGDDLYERKLQHLREAIEILSGLQKEWTEAPFNALVAHLHLKATEELSWEQRFGRRYETRPVTPKAGKALGEIVTPPERPVVAIDTNKGTITCELFFSETPNAVANFLALAAEGFYDGITWHRVGPDAQTPPVIQGGCPKGDGSGGPGYTIDSELVAALEFEAGTLCWANRGRNTAGSQFYICKEKVDDLSWKGSYTRFGKVLEGLDVAQKITKGDRIQAVRILKRHGTPTDFPYAPRVLWIPKLDPKAAAGQ